VASTSPSTGALILSGSDGLGVGGAIWSGGGVNLASTATTGLRIFNTSDTTTNYEALQFYWNSNVAFVRTVPGGTGAARSLQLATVGSSGIGVSITLDRSAAAPFMLLDVTSSNSTAGAVLLKLQSSAAYAQTSGANYGVVIAPTYNQASGTAANTDLYINRTQTAVGSGTQRFIDCAIAGTSYFNVSSSGVVGSASGFSGPYITNNSGLNVMNGGVFSTATTGLTLNASSYTGASVAQIGAAFNATVNQTGTSSFTDLYINRTNTAAGSGNQYLFNAALGGVSKTYIDTAGNVVITGSFTPSTTGGIKGTTAADNANAGSVGELLSSTQATPVSLTTGTAANVLAATLTLTAGDWDVWGIVYFTPTATTSITQMAAGISATSAALPSLTAYTGAVNNWQQPAQVPGSTNPIAVEVGPIRVNVNTSTNYYLVAQGGFTASTLTAAGSLYARRRR
jgi:hypothetical protein